MIVTCVSGAERQGVPPLAARTWHHALVGPRRVAPAALSQHVPEDLRREAWLATTASPADSPCVSAALHAQEEPASQQACSLSPADSQHVGPKSLILLRLTTRLLDTGLVQLVQQYHDFRLIQEARTDALPAARGGGSVLPLDVLK